MSLTTHVLDLATGYPAQGMGVLLSVRTGDGWHELARGATDADGRAAFDSDAPLPAAIYRLRFETGDWFREMDLEHFWPHVEITFTIREPEEHHHVPLLLSPFGYSTYRGS